MGNNLSDEEILDLVRRKDPGAFEALYKAYQGRLTATAIHFLGYEDQDYLDMVQETFAVALKKLPETEIQTNLYGWLNRICALLCYERLRQRKKQLSSLQEDMEFFSGGLAKERDQESSEQLERQEKLDFLRRQIARLDAPCKKLVTLRDLEGKSYADIARVLGVPLGTAMSRLARCRQALKDLVREALGDLDRD
jgi:RNA polymerase sigma-70 factor (ECF subfamily)